jgi:hypothetical protein
MNEEKMKELLIFMTKEIYGTFRLLSEENKKLVKRIEELEKKFESIEKK